MTGTRSRSSGTASLPAYTRALEALRFAADPEDPEEGVRQIRIRVSDGNLFSNTATALITVEAENDAPTVVNGPLDERQTGLDGTPLAPVEAAESFQDVDDDDLGYSFGGSTPDWLAIDPETGRITGTPPADASQIVDPQTGREGRYEVRVRATDPGNAFAETTVVYQIENPAPIAVRRCRRGQRRRPAHHGQRAQRSRRRPRSRTATRWSSRAWRTARAMWVSPCPARAAARSSWRRTATTSSIPAPTSCRSPPAKAARPRSPTASRTGRAGSTRPRSSSPSSAPTTVPTRATTRSERARTGRSRATSWSTTAGASTATRTATGWRSGG